MSWKHPRTARGRANKTLVIVVGTFLALLIIVAHYT